MTDLSQNSSPMDGSEARLKRIRTLANTKSNEYVRYSDRKAAGEVT